MIQPDKDEILKKQQAVKDELKQLFDNSFIVSNNYNTTLALANQQEVTITYSPNSKDTE